MNRLFSPLTSPPACTLRGYLVNVGSYVMLGILLDTHVRHISIQILFLSLGNYAISGMSFKYLLLAELWRLKWKPCLSQCLEHSKPSLHDGIGTPRMASYSPHPTSLVTSFPALQPRDIRGLPAPQSCCGRLVGCLLYLFPLAAVTSDRKLGGLRKDKGHSPTTVEVRSLKWVSLG